MPDRPLTLMERFVIFWLTGSKHLMAQKMLMSAKHQVSDTDFADFCGLPDTKMNEVSLRALHIWILHLKIKEDEEDFQEELVYNLFEKLWEDLDDEMYQAGATFMKRHKEEAQAGIFGALKSYDKALGIYLNEGDSDPFLGAIWRNMYDGEKEMDKAHLIQMRDYIFRERENILAHDKHQFYNGFITWGDPPNAMPKACPESEGLDKTLARNKMFDHRRGHHL